MIYIKTYKHLWDTFVSDKTIARAVHDAMKGKTRHKKITKLLDNNGEKLEDYMDSILWYAEHFRPREHSKTTIVESSSGKKREITVPAFDEHVIHHMIVITLEDLFTRGMDPHTYSSIPGRGLHMCMKRIKKWITKDKKHTHYYLKMDIHKFFQSVNQDILIARLRKYIKDKRFMDLVEKVIRTGEKGLPLGFYTSHWFANWLLQPLDHFIREELRADHYARYMDDMLLFSDSKEELHHDQEEIERYLCEKLDLDLKTSWTVAELDWTDKNGKHHGGPLDFVGFKFYRNKIQLRKSLLKRMRRKAAKIRKKNKFTIHDARQMMSWLGWVNWSDTYRIYKRYVSPTVGFKKCRKRIKKFDKRERAWDKKVDMAFMIAEHSDKKLKKYTKS